MFLKEWNLVVKRTSKLAQENMDHSLVEANTYKIALMFSKRKTENNLGRCRWIQGLAQIFFRCEI